MTKKPYKPVPPEHSRFKPGVSGNPNGRPKQHLSADQVSSLMGKFGMVTRDQLQAVVQNPKSTMIEIMIASVMVKAAKDGDYSRFEFLLSRTIGKVTDKMEIQAKPTMMIHRPDGTAIELTQGELPELESGE